MTPEEEQEAVVAFLSDPATHGGAPVRRIETHLSHLFLAGDRAWKMKKAVRFPFVDFTPLAARQAACETELRVNRRTAPSLYLGVVPVTRSGAGFALGGAGTLVEPLVEMRRFPDGALFSELAGAGQLERRHLRDLADRVAAMHLSTPPILPGDIPRPLSVTAANVAREITDLAAAHAPALTEEARKTGAAIEGAILACSGRLAARARRGTVREGHGDLHLANVCLVEGQATPFDAIEFDPAIRIIDTLYDVAFTVADLAAGPMAAEVPVFLGRYLSATRDYRCADLLAPMAALRAGVRALVALASPGGGRAEEAAARLTQASAFLAPPPPPRLIAIGGRSGTGKSTLAAALAPGLAPPPWAVILRSDEIRKRLAGVAPETALPPTAYTQASSDAVYQRMMRDAARALSAGLSVVLDAAFLTPAERAAAADLAAAAGAGFHGFWLQAPEEVLTARIAARAAAPGGDASDATSAVMLRQPDDGGTGWCTLETAGDARAVAKAARALMARGCAAGSRA
ncbi:MAG: AAA family ATPase [Pseudomonadota bacterium]